MGSFDGQRVTVMGLGRFGGGLGVARFLTREGADVLITDLQTEDRLRDGLAELRDLIDAGAVTLRLGGHNVSDFTDTDLVVANPAVAKPWDNRFLRAAGAANVPVTTEMRLLVERLNRERVIGVTGSAGKSTTTAMIHHALSALGHRAHLGGNIGGSLLEQLDAARDEAIRPADFICLELSSFMLHWLGEGVGSPGHAGYSPKFAVLTNLSPNHLDWHETFAHYEASKRNIARYQQPGDVFIEGSTFTPDRAIPLRLPGAHNQQNAFIALTMVARVLNAPLEAIAESLRDFPGLPDRLQFIGEVDGVKCYNDSKSTTPEATLLAVRAFDDPKRVHLIAGGSEKGSDLSPIGALAPSIAGLYTIGLTGPKIAASAPSRANVFACETLDRAIDAALDRAQPGDALVLSPGCASFDQYTNYQARGQAFVRNITARGAEKPR